MPQVTGQTDGRLVQYLAGMSYRIRDGGHRGSDEKSLTVWPATMVFNINCV